MESIQLPDTGNPPQTLRNYEFGSCGGNLEQLVVNSCDADFATIGQLLGAQALVTQAELYGYNQRVPLDVPPSTVAASHFGTVADFATDLPGLMKSAIGQDNVAATALQQAMVAGTVANGGVEMTPHVMAQIRSSDGGLVRTYQPTPWMQPISPQTAATLTTFMQGVVRSGTASGVGFPASWNVAAKTGTARGRPEPAIHDRLAHRFRTGREFQGRGRGCRAEPGIPPDGGRHRRADRAPDHRRRPRRPGRSEVKVRGEACNEACIGTRRENPESPRRGA